MTDWWDDDLLAELWDFKWLKMSPAQILRFYTWLGNKMAEWRWENQAAYTCFLTKLEGEDVPVFQGRWIEQIGDEFEDYDEMTERDYRSVKGLVRFIRHVACHPELLKESEEHPEGWDDRSICNYFDKRFPHLLPTAYGAASWICGEQKWFEGLHHGH